MILVTGASGMVGREVARALRARGLSIRLFVRSALKLPADLAGAGALAIGDFAERKSVDAAMRGVERLYLTSFDGPDAVEAQAEVIRAAKAADVRLVVRLSAPAADPQASANYARWHGECERLLERSGIPFVHLRPNWYMDNFLYEYGRGGVVRLPAGSARLSFVDARDIAAVAVEALLEPGHAGRTYAPTGPAALSHEEVVAELSRASGRPYRYESLLLDDYAEELRAGATPDWWIEEMVDLIERLRRGENEPTTDHVEHVVGRASIAFAQFARDHAQTLRTRL